MKQSVWNNPYISKTGRYSDGKSAAGPGVFTTLPVQQERSRRLSSDVASKYRYSVRVEDLTATKQAEVKEHKPRAQPQPPPPPPHSGRVQVRVLSSEWSYIDLVCESLRQSMPWLPWVP